MTDKALAAASTHSTSISRWVEKMQTIFGVNGGLPFDILTEESTKIGRLGQLSEKIGLPIYDTCEFKLPAEFDLYRARCAQIVSDGIWQLAIRFSKPPLKEAFFR